MSSADEAFTKLLGKNALNIPVANPSAEARGGTRTGRPIAAAAPRAGAGKSGAMQVLDMLDGVAGDYSPQQQYGVDTDNVFATPTETDLDPVDAEAGTADTQRQGTRIMGLAAADIDDDEEEEPDLRDASIVDDIGVEADLRRARRFRRFAYLPLSGMEHFESRARDIMASLTSQDPDRPSLAITSPTRGDGQTELAIRLALAMAKRVDYRILLADFDLRKPQIAMRLGLSSKHFTLADVLRGSCPLGEALMVSEEDNLYVLPARASDRDGDEVLDDREVQALLSQVHATFDFTIIGCGPVDHAAAGIVCRHAGAAALAGYCGRTKASALRRTADRLIRNGVNLAGMLLTGA